MNKETAADRVLEADRLLLVAYCRLPVAAAKVSHISVKAGTVASVEAGVGGVADATAFTQSYSQAK